MLSLLNLRRKFCWMVRIWIIWFYYFWLSAPALESDHAYGPVFCRLFTLFHHNTVSKNSTSKLPTPGHFLVMRTLTAGHEQTRRAPRVPSGDRSVLLWHHSLFRYYCLRTLPFESSLWGYSALFSIPFPVLPISFPWTKETAFLFLGPAVSFLPFSFPSFSSPPFFPLLSCLRLWLNCSVLWPHFLGLIVQMIFSTLRQVLSMDIFLMFTLWDSGLEN